MILRQRVATRLLLLVCILLLNCALQPLTRLAQLEIAAGCHMLTVPSSAIDVDEDGRAATPQPGSCQLNGKWLSAASVQCAEQLFFAIAFLIALLAPLSRCSPPLPPPRNISPPERRLHLTLCVWRE
ncbi:hypothetical protein [Aeromonas sp. 600724]|uniref:hypothetical protein n=1 Tax=Aeromonas sp. 600724 TaxID=2712031 RepID=UPI003BA016F4